MNKLLLDVRLQSACRDLSHGMALARALAITGNRRMLLIIDHDGRVEVRSDAHDERDDHASSALLLGEPAKELAVAVRPAGAHEVTFNGLGWSVANADGSPSISSIDIRPRNQPATAQLWWRVQVSGAGNIAICDVTSAGTPAANC